MGAVLIGKSLLISANTIANTMDYYKSTAQPVNPHLGTGRTIHNSHCVISSLSHSQNHSVKRTASGVPRLCPQVRTSPRRLRILLADRYPGALVYNG